MKITKAQAQSKCNVRHCSGIPCWNRVVGKFPAITFYWFEWKKLPVSKVMPKVSRLCLQTAKKVKADIIGLVHLLTFSYKVEI